MSRVLAAIPYARFLGVEEARSDGALELVLPFRDEIVGNMRLPAVHGGVLGAFLELTALLRLIDESGTDRVPKPITFSVDYLRSAGPTTTRARWPRATASFCSDDRCVDHGAARLVRRACISWVGRGAVRCETAWCLTNAGGGGGG